ncbi:MAG: hypothetical protein ACE5HO_07330 [bacterium]
MVDINLMGDEKSEEEDRIEDLSQSSNLEAQDFTFEDKTDTFDTSRTVDYSFKSRNYPSGLSTLIILAIIVILGGAAYYFLFRGDKKPEPQQMVAEDNPQFEETVPANAEPGTTSEPAAAEVPSNVEPKSQPAATQPDNQPTSRPEPPASSTINDILSTSAGEIVSKSKFAIETVNDIVASMPSNINLTLLSFTGERLRMEFVAASEGDAQDYTGQISQSSSARNIVVLSESKVPANGQALDKVLISGTVPNFSESAPTGSVRSLTVSQARSWLKQATGAQGLSLRQFKSNQASYSDGHQRIPVLVRISGNKASLMSFLQDLGQQNFGIELSKILLVSPDMARYDDTNLLLVLNMYLYQES